MGAIEGGGVPDVPSWEGAPGAARLGLLASRIGETEAQGHSVCGRCLSRARSRCPDQSSTAGTLAIVELEAETRPSDLGLGSLLWLQPPLAPAWLAWAAPARSISQGRI